MIVNILGNIYTECMEEYKMDNWFSLEKAFQKRSAPVLNSEEWVGISHAKSKGCKSILSRGNNMGEGPQVRQNMVDLNNYKMAVI